MAEAAGGHAQDTAPIAAPVVVVDTSEPPEMLTLLAAREVQVERRRLAPADYVVGAVRVGDAYAPGRTLRFDGGPIALERKSVGDFHASMIDKRLFEQVARLKETYPTCALILEGDPAFFDERRSPRATWGALCSLAFDFDLQVIPTSGRAATAELLGVLARRVVRERGAGGGGPEVRYKPRLLGPHAEQKFAVQGLPGIGDVVSENLLQHFGSVRRVYAANERELLRVPGIGKGRAADIREFLDRPFEGRQKRL